MPDSSADRHHFDFDLDRGIRVQVVEKLESSPLLPLTKGTGPQVSGIYALYFKGKLVYIGKASKGTTKSKRTLRARLSEHVVKISGRKNISLGDMTCRYLTFASEWWVFAAEFALITEYQPEWNASGFGSKTPGVGRPGTARVSRWNELFPNLNNQIAYGEPGFISHPHKITVRPLRFVIVHHIRNLRKQQSIRLQYPLRLRQEWRIQIAQVPIVLFATFYRRSEVHIEPLPALVPALRADVWRIVHHCTELCGGHA